MGKSLLPDEVRGAYQVDEWHFPAWSKALVEVVQEFKLRTGVIAKTWRRPVSEIEGPEERQHKRIATDYSRMNYEELRKIADTDPIADQMSNDEYESLSVELWRKFSAEKLTS